MEKIRIRDGKNSDPGSRIRKNTDYRIVLDSPLGRLSGEHDAVGSVENGVGDVPRLRPGGTRLLHHRLQHLSCADDRLSGP
jgi:hypothetical protein